MATFFDALVSAGQAGRIQPANYTPTEGTWCMVLGSDAPGALEYVVPGDYAAVLQNGVDWTAADVVRVLGMVRIPENTPDTFGWELVMMIGAGYELAWSLVEMVGAETMILDYSANVSELASTYISAGIRFTGPGTDPVLAEIPAFYVDVVSAVDEADDVVLVATLPADSQTGVPADLPYGLTLSIAPLDGTLVVGGSINVTVDGVPAVVAGVVTLPFVGSVTAAQGASSLDTIVALTSGWETFASEYVVEVEVSATTVGAAELDTSYSFTIVDYAPPQLVSARALSDTEIELTYSEPVTMVLAAGSTDVLNPVNYSLAAVTIPAALPGFVGVTALSSTVVVLELDDGLSFGAMYTLTAENVTDLIGNVIVAPDNAVELIGFDPPWPACRSFSLWEMLAGVHRSSDISGDLAGFISCLQDVLDQLLFAIDKWAEIIDPDTAEEQYIDAMLVGLGNPFRFDLSLADKRLLISVLVKIYQSKGTKTGIENAVFLFLGFEIEIVPRNDSENAWILDLSELGEDTELFTSESAVLYTFDVTVAIDLTTEQMATMLTIIDYMKVGHEHIGLIFQPGDVPPPEFWLLGESELDTETELGQNG